MLVLNGWCAWLVCMAGVHAWCAWLVCMRGVHAWCAWLLLLLLLSMLWCVQLYGA
jgi:hypothetical protein